jgi:taurine dioxygenase
MPAKHDTFKISPLPGASFGGIVDFPGDVDAHAVISAIEAGSEAFLEAFYAAHGFLLIKGMHAINDDPRLLVRLSALFGLEVEDYRQTLARSHDIHAEVPEILLVSNIAPAVARVPAPPNPPLTEDGELPVQFPHRRGWHTDQSFRRPPPDISLFYAETPAPKGQGQTLYADGIGAYDALTESMKECIEPLVGIHISPGRGRAEYAVRAGETPQDLKPHEQPQRQPVVRVHPVTGQRALYLCEAGQMDWIEGPFEGMEQGVDGDGAKLLYELMSHYTDPRFTYAHDWDAGDLVIYDNRCLIHSATWFDSEIHQRRMWRTTVWGNPGPLYDGERPSWVPV